MADRKTRGWKPGDEYPQGEAYWTPAMAAHFLGIKPNELNAKCLRGEVPFVPIGRTRRFHPDDLRKLSYTPPAPPPSLEPIEPPTVVTGSPELAEEIYRVPAAVPGELSGLNGKLRELPIWRTPPAVYFLLKQGRVVYVGQTTALAARVAAHREAKDFDQVLYLPVPARDLVHVESAFIRKLRPTLNGCVSDCDSSRDASILAAYGCADFEVNHGS